MNNDTGTLLCAAVGLIFIAGAAVKIAGNVFFLRLAKKTIGTVVGFQTGLTSDRHTVYLPVVEFSPVAEHKVQITSTVGANPPDYRIGDSVEVRFMPKKPHAGRIYSFSEMWILPLIFLVIGLIVLGTGFFLLPK
jgi:hypothetical protein